MNIVVENVEKVVVPKVGDILEFKTGKGEGTYYLVSADNTRSSTKSKYFLVNLKGTIGGEVCYYDSLEAIVKNRKNQYRIFPADSVTLKLNEAEVVE